MNSKKSHKVNFSAMLKQRADSVESTCKKLHEALDRFEHKQLTVLPAGSKLTVRNLAVEAGVSKDTPLSRYSKHHPASGAHRFASVVERFNGLKVKLNSHRPRLNEECEIKRLRKRIKGLERMLLLSARANNLLDAEVVDIRAQIKEIAEDNERLRAENANLRQGSLRVLRNSN